MIVQAEGSSHSVSGVSGGATKIVSFTGTAYVKRGKIKAIIRTIKKVVRAVQAAFKPLAVVPFVGKQNTKSGIPTSLAPPLIQ